LFVTTLLSSRALAVANVIFSVPGAAYTSPTAINSNGDVVGCYGPATGCDQGFLRTSDGTITSITVPGSISTAPMTLTDQKAISGIWLDQNNILHGFMVSSAGGGSHHV